MINAKNPDGNGFITHYGLSYPPGPVQGGSCSLRQCPALPVDVLPEELVMEWSELLGLGLRCHGSKKARKEQKQLEEMGVGPLSCFDFAICYELTH